MANALGSLIKQVATPQEFHRNALEIDLAALHKRGIKLLLPDLNGTLVPEAENTPTVRVGHWVQKVKNSGLQIALLTNSAANQRIRHIAEILECRVYALVCKPFTGALKEIIEKRFCPKLFRGGDYR